MFTECFLMPGQSAYAPLYADAEFRLLPETPTWRTHGAPGPLFTHPSDETGPCATVPWQEWAEVLIDLRRPEHQHIHPCPPTDTKTVIASDAPGWDLDLWYSQTSLTPPAPAIAVTVARFTTPDGFRFAVIVSTKTAPQKRRPAVGLLATLFGRARFVFVGQSDTSRRGAKPHISHASTLNLDGFHNRSQTYDLPALAAAIRDPALWFGGPEDPNDDWAAMDTGVPVTITPASYSNTHTVQHGPALTPHRVLLDWALAGATSFASIRHWAQAGLSAHELAACRDAKIRDEDIIEWTTAFGMTKKRREYIADWYPSGVAPATAARWHQLLGLRDSAPRCEFVIRFEDAGWDPDTVLRVGNALTRATPPGRYLSPAALNSTTTWTFLSPPVAISYITAGYTANEARAIEDLDQRPDDATFAVLGALQDRTPADDNSW